MLKNYVLQFANYVMHFKWSANSGSWKRKQQRQRQILLELLQRLIPTFIKYFAATYLGLDSHLFWPLSCSLNFSLFAISIMYSAAPGAAFQFQLHWADASGGPAQKNVKLQHPDAWWLVG